MQIDRKALEGLLSLNDKQLISVLNRLATESGIDVSSFNVDTSCAASIRQAISGASDAELEQIAAQYQAGINAKGANGRK